MELKQLDAPAIKKAFLSATAALANEKEKINELNVFPVPDGDTGTNMTMTLTSAATDVNVLNDPDMDTLCKAMTQGTLRGARGNSGVILSQLIRGFCRVIREKPNVNVAELSSAFTKGVENAYKAVMKPKEGTILTVAKAMSEKAAELAPTESDILAFLQQVIDAGNDMLEKTPDMLPVLKQAGVVDSGGKGLMVTLRGAYESLMGRDVVRRDENAAGGKGESIYVTIPSGFGEASDDIETADIKFNYCTEFIIDAGISPADEMRFKKFLEQIGDSIVCVADEDLVKVHVHTNHPGRAIEEALKYGMLNRLKIDNMLLEHNELYKQEKAKAEQDKPVQNTIETQPEKANEERLSNGFISVTAGSGLTDLFSCLGVNYVISGGQTMNPSTEDLLHAIEMVNAETIYIFPNNKNIIMAAQQAAYMEKFKKIVVIPSKSIPQGISAMLAFIEDGTPEQNEEAMNEAMSAVKTCEITYSIRDTEIDGFVINKDDIMAIGDSGMLAVDKDVHVTVGKAIEQLVDEYSSMITVYYGEGIKEEEAQVIADELMDRYPDIDISVQFGGQPVYYFIISVE